MKHDYSIIKQKGIHEVKSGKERVIVDNRWSIEVPAGYSYCADIQKTAEDIHGNHYFLQIQRTSDSDFSVGYGSAASITVSDEYISFNGYTSSVQDVKDLVMQFANASGSAEIIKENKNILVVLVESAFISSSYVLHVLLRGRNIIYKGQMTFEDDIDLDIDALAHSLAKSIEPVLIEDLAETDKLAGLDNSYLVDLDTDDYLNVDNAFRVPIPKGYEASFELSKQYKAFVVPKGTAFTDTGCRCKVGFIMTQEPFNNTSGTNTNQIIETIRKAFLDQSGFDFYNPPVTTVKTNTKGTIVYSAITNNACDQNTNPVMIVTKDKIYHCVLAITYDGPISDEMATRWDSNVITTAWLSRILFKGEKAKEKTKGFNEVYTFKKAEPEKALYPHYDHKLNYAPSIPGAQVVVNQGGTDYQFFVIAEAAGPDNDGIDEERRALLKRIVECDSADYEMYNEAKRLSGLFHVDSTVFNLKDDREAELANGYMKKAYMLSALRSFAWTLASYCEENKKKPEDVDINEIKSLVDFVSNTNWLNYDSISYCKGLCSGQDLHVYYVSDSASDEDKRLLGPSEEDYERVKQMKSISPAYNEILQEVQSLDALRKDLSYIYPAIKKIHEDLSNNRNRSKQLEGNEADVLYAWCALTLAAKGPFFTEDGPMSYFLSQPEVSVLDEKSSKTAPATEVDSTNTKTTKADLGKNNKWKFAEVDTKSIKTNLISNKDGYALRFLSLPEIKGSIDLKEIEDEFRTSMTIHRPEYVDDVKTIQSAADKFSEHIIQDNENYLKQGALISSEPLHALRSLLWTATHIQSEKKLNEIPVDAPSEMWVEMAEFIAERGNVNYKGYSKTSLSFGHNILVNREAPIIYTSSKFPYDENLFTKQLGSRDDYKHYINLSAELVKLLPIMEIYNDYLEDCTEKEALVARTIRNILEGWSALAYACNCPFCIVAKKIIKNDVFVEEKESWAQPVETIEYENGKYTAIGTSLIRFKDDSEVLDIPEGITDICFNEPFYLDWKLENTKKIVYPSTFTGTIMLPVCAEEVEILADMDCPEFDRNYESDTEPALRKLTFKGVIKTFRDNMGQDIYESKHLEELNLPEGLEKIEDYDLGQNSLTHIVIPETLKSISERELSTFGGMLEFPTTEITVYRTCPALKQFQELWKECKESVDSSNELADQFPNLGREKYPFTLNIIDAPWISKARRFIDRVGNLYKAEGEENYEYQIDSALNGIFDSEIEFRNAKKHISDFAKKHGLISLAEIVEEAIKNNSEQQLPSIIAKDIESDKEKRRLATIEEKRKEIQSLMSSDNIEDINSAMDLIKSMSSDFTDSQIMINSCLERIGVIKDEQYVIATEKMKEGAAESLLDAMRLFETLGDYKDSANKLSVIKEKFDHAIVSFREKALVLFVSAEEQDLAQAKEIYEYLKTIDFDADRCREYEERLEAIKTLESLQQEVAQLKEKHSQLGGLFKKKQRLEVEDQIRVTEAKILTIRQQQK